MHTSSGPAEKKSKHLGLWRERVCSLVLLRREDPSAWAERPQPISAKRWFSGASSQWTAGAHTGDIDWTRESVVLVTSKGNSTAVAARDLTAVVPLHYVSTRSFTSEGSSTGSHSFSVEHALHEDHVAHISRGQREDTLAVTDTHGNSFSFRGCDAPAWVTLLRAATRRYCAFEKVTHLASFTLDALSPAAAGAFIQVATEKM